MLAAVLVAAVAKAEISASCWIVTKLTIRLQMEEKAGLPVRDGPPPFVDYLDGSQRVNSIVPQEQGRLTNEFVPRQKFDVNTLSRPPPSSKII